MYDFAYYNTGVCFGYKKRDNIMSTTTMTAAGLCRAYSLSVITTYWLYVGLHG